MLAISLREQWLELAKMCKAVVACRVSPLQKAEVVRYARSPRTSLLRLLILIALLACTFSATLDWLPCCVSDVACLLADLLTC